MNLPDFTEFSPFNELRNKCGTTELGYFELFDPIRHLTGAERSELERSGYMVAVADVSSLPDRTLNYKNSRVIAYVPDANWYRNHREYPSYHLARCSALEALKRDNPNLQLLVTSRRSEDYPIVTIDTNGQVASKLQTFVVCKQCLHALRYKDYDEFRNRRRGYSQRVLEQFQLAEFFRLYKQYPLGFNAKRHHSA